jgi:hypothetical protein
MGSHHDWATRHNKALARQSVLKRIRGARVDRGFFLPGFDVVGNDGALCVQEALRSGLIDAETKLVVAESDRTLVPLIEGKLDDLGFTGRYRLHAEWMDGRLGTRKLEFFEDERFDFAFFDLMGCLNKDTSLWIVEHFLPQLNEGASLAFTIRYNLRRDSLARATRAVLKSDHPFYEDGQYLAKHYNAANSPNLVIHSLMLHAILHGWTFTPRPPLQYIDNRAPMIAFRFDNLRRIEDDAKPTIYDLHKLPRPVSPVRALHRVRPKSQSPKENDVKLNTLISGLATMSTMLPSIPANRRADADRLAKALLAAISPTAKSTTNASARAVKAWETRRANQTAQSATVAASIVVPQVTTRKTRGKATPVLTRGQKAAATRRANKATAAQEVLIKEGAPLPKVRTSVNRRSSGAVKAWNTRRANGWVHPRARSQASA